MLDPSTPARRHWQLLSLLLLLALAVRLYGIGNSSLWLDEFCSLETATGRGLAHVALPTDQLLPAPTPALTTLDGARPWWSIWTSMRLDNHPPLYFVLLRFWMEAFSSSDATIRAMSIVPSLAAIVFLFFAVREQFGASTALWASALMALAMPQIHYAQEARGYSLFIALGVASCAAVIAIEKRGANPKRLIAVASAVLGMLLTHYFAIAPVAVLLLYTTLRFRGRPRQLLIVSLLAAVVVYAIVWGPFLYQQRSSVQTNNAWQLDPAPGHTLRTLGRAAQLPLRFLAEPATPLLPTISCIGVLAYLIPAFFLRRRPELLLWYLWLLIPVLMVVGIDLVRHARHTDLIRYSVVASPAIYVLIAAVANRIRWTRLILPAAAVLYCLINLPRTYSTDTGWIVLADTLEAHVHAGDTVVYASAGRDDWYAGALYLGVSHYARSLPAAVVLTAHSVPTSLAPSVSSHPIWLVAGSEQVAPEQIVPGAKVEERLSIPNVGTLYQLRVVLGRE